MIRLNVPLKLITNLTSKENLMVTKIVYISVLKNFIHQNRVKKGKNSVVTNLTSLQSQVVC